MTKKNSIKNLLNKIEKRDDGCWQWLGALNKFGYSTTGWLGRSRLAYHIFFEHFKEDRNKDLRIDHICRNRACVNPDHLRQITHKENCKIGNHIKNNKELRKTHCPKGHEYNKENTYFEGNWRHCKICRRIQRMAYHLRAKKYLNKKCRDWYQRKKQDPIWMEKERIRNKIRMRKKRILHKLSNQSNTLQILNKSTDHITKFV